MINKNAIFSDGTRDYRTPCEPERHSVVSIYIRLAIEHNFVNLITSSGVVEMKLKETEDFFQYYQGEIQVEEAPVSYYFEIRSKSGEVCYYNRLGVTDEVKDEFGFLITPGFRTPEWAKGAVYYQIFVDRFYNGNPSNDVEDGEYIYLNDKTVKVKDWNKYPESVGVREFYGGDLEGVDKKLLYLKELGIEVIYFNPIFVSPSNHKYDTQDYDYVDPHFGVIINDANITSLEEESSNAHVQKYTNSNAQKYKKRVTDYENLKESNALFIRFVEKAHSLGMKVVLDGVFNHCGSFHKWLDREGIYKNAHGFLRGAYEDENSPYREYFNFRTKTWPNNTSYDGWWGYDTLPKLNYEGSKKLYDYMLEIGRKWVSPPYYCDGWRLDVAADLGLSKELNHTFWKDFRTSVKSANPDAIILAEHYGNPKEWLEGDEWDTVMNYDAFMEPVTWFLTGMEKHSDAFKENLLNSYEDFKQSMIYHMSSFQTSSLQTAMNELSNHDHSRFLTRTNKIVGRTQDLGAEAANKNIDKGVMKEAVTLQMTWPGAPTIYYGDEAGLCGFTDPDNRRTYPWGREDQELLDFHKEIIGIHKSYQAFKTGSFKLLNGSNGVITYARFDKKDKFIIALNNNDYEINIDIHVWEAGITGDKSLSRILFTTRESFSTEVQLFNTRGGILKLWLPPVSSIICNYSTPSNVIR
ncbi:MAG: glycoside hydrolase family 13 protein [Anaerocolumna sp.]